MRGRGFWDLAREVLAAMRRTPRPTWQPRRDDGVWDASPEDLVGCSVEFEGVAAHLATLESKRFWCQVRKVLSTVALFAAGAAVLVFLVILAIARLFSDKRGKGGRSGGSPSNPNDAAMAFLAGMLWGEHHHHDDA